MTTPVLVHLPGLFGEDWSCTTTVSPTWSAGRSLAPSERRSSILACRFAWACSLRSASSLHSFRGWYLVNGHDGWQKTLQFSPKYNHGRAELGERVNCIAMLKECACKRVRVEGAFGAKVAHHKALGCFDGHLCPFVGPRVVGGGDPVGDAPARKEVLDGCGGENCCSASCGTNPDL